MKETLNYDDFKSGDKVKVFDPRTIEWEHPIETIYTVEVKDKVKILFRTREDSLYLTRTLDKYYNYPEYVQIEIVKE